MDGFKDSTRMKYMSDSGGVYNERGKRATMAEIAAEDRRMVEAAPKKPVGPSSAAVSKAIAGMAKKAVPAGGIGGGAMAGAASGALAGAAARAAAKAIPRGMGAMSDREMQMLKAEAAAKKAVPSYSDRPVIRRNKGGLMAMPKGKC
jgi:hypothetical protein